MVFCFTSCVNFWEAMRISKTFPKEYTGLDTIIKIDGYYYLDDSIGIGAPILISNNRKIQFFAGRYLSHIEIQEELKHNKSSWTGSYILKGDTIKVQQVRAYDLTSYDIFSIHYLIMNDTTLKRIWHFCETCDKKKHDPIRNDIYKFYQYHIDIK